MTHGSNAAWWPHGATLGRRRTVLRGLAALLVLPLLRPPAGAAQEAPLPDFSGVTSKAAARKLVRRGELVEIALFPVELGGPDDPLNISFITPEAALVRELTIGTFGRFAEEGTIDQLRVAPDYKGASVVPSRITMTASHSGQEGSIATTIEVW